MTLVIAACGWQLVLLVVFSSRLPSRSNRMNLCGSVSSAAVQHGTTQSWRGPCAHAPAVLWVLHTVSISVPQLHAVPQYRPDLLHFTENTPPRLGSKQAQRPSPLSTRRGTFTELPFRILIVLRGLLKLWMFYHLPKCEVNLAIFVAACTKWKATII